MNNEDTTVPNPLTLQSIWVTANQAKALQLYKTTDFTYAVDSIQQKALQAANAMDDMKIRRTVATIAAIQLPLPVYQNTGYANDTAMYIVNFADNQGFVIMPGDQRIAANMLAFVPKGHFNIDAPTNNDNFLFVVQKLIPAYIVASVQLYNDSSVAWFQQATNSIMPRFAKAAKQYDASLFNATCGSHAIENTTYHYAAFTTQQKKPADMADGCMTRYFNNYGYEPNANSYSYGTMVTQIWNQDWPYNAYCPNYQCTNTATDNLNQHAYAGCTPVAIGQLMAFYQYPSSIANAGAYGTLYWNNMLSSSITTPDNTQIPQLLSWIGAFTQTTYGCPIIGVPPLFLATGTNSAMINSFLVSQGYHTGGLVAYNTNQAIVDFKNNRIEIVCGFSDQQQKYGHTWLIDQYKADTGTRWSNSSQVTYCPPTQNKNNIVASWFSPTYYCTYTYAEGVHCNWGWGGDCNGYVAPGVFNPNVSATNPDITNQAMNPASSTTNQPVYSYNVQAVINIYHN